MFFYILGLRILLPKEKQKLQTSLSRSINFVFANLLKNWADIFFMILITDLHKVDSLLNLFYSIGYRSN